jgi:hypothetical protein
MKRQRFKQCHAAAHGNSIQLLTHSPQLAQSSFRQIKPPTMAPSTTHRIAIA